MVVAGEQAATMSTTIKVPRRSLGAFCFIAFIHSFLITQTNRARSMAGRAVHTCWNSGRHLLAEFYEIGVSATLKIILDLYLNESIRIVVLNGILVIPKAFVPCEREYNR